MKDWLWVVLALLVLAGGFMLQRSGLLQAQAEREIVDVDCDIQATACQLSLQALSELEFSIQPRPFNAMQPLTLELKLLSGQPVNSAVKVRFEGLNMDMGFNQVNLEAISDRVYSAKAMLPACTAAEMFWHFHLLIDLNDKAYDMRFPVVTR